MDSPPQTIMVRGGVFLWTKSGERYAGHGVVGKKQSGLEEKG